MNKSAEFTMAQLAAIELLLATVLARPPKVSAKLGEIDDDTLSEISDVMWKLPTKTTRQYVTREAVIEKVTGERARRQAREDVARALGGNA